MQEFQYGLKLSEEIVKREVHASLSFFFSFPSLLQMPARAKKYKGPMFGVVRAKGRKGKYRQEKKKPQNFSISKTPSY